MDRFIVDMNNRYIIVNGKFKIQYGQIYSLSLGSLFASSRNLKSNMDRFIAMTACSSH